MAYDIDKLHAVQVGGSVTTDHDASTVQGRIPASLDPQKLIKVLMNLDLAVPKSLTVAASRGDPLHTSRHKYTTAEVDAALARHKVPMSEKIHFKATLARCGIMER